MSSEYLFIIPTDPFWRPHGGDTDPPSIICAP
jgi:hypothetical protein